MQGGILLQWLGHACFLLKLLASGFAIVIDPFPAEHVGYKPINVKADLVLITHGHFDHNYIQAVQGKPKVIDKPGEHKVGKIRIIGYKTSHGEGRGENIVFIVEAGNLRIAHCGDLGVLPSEEDVKSVGRIDVALVPVGGFFTIDANQAWQLVQMAKPKVVIPMHYRHSQSKITQIAPVDDFLKGKKNVKRIKGNSVMLSKDKLPKDMEIWVLEAP
ncbi:MAG: MBL fold metallo-hydrolase [Armatimonadetes bacterium]|nr:MBL fold metallo-hydrolase [Armatimonadota bacterium]